MNTWLTDWSLLAHVLVFFGGVVAGLYGSNVGSGSLVSFTTLILIGIPTHIAIATNRFAVIFVEVVSAIRFKKEIKFNVKFGIVLGVLAAVGAYLGSNIVVSVEEELLNVIVAIALVFVFGFLLISKKIGKKILFKRNHRLLFLVFAFPILGIYGGFFGGGFGTFALVLLVISGYSYVQGAALSRVIGGIMSATATVVFAMNGIIDYSNGIILGFGYALGGWIGAGIGAKRGDKFIKILLSVVIVISVIKLLI